MKKIALATLSILGACLFSTPAHSASFDCNKADTWVEKTICQSPELSKLDDALATKYKNELDDFVSFEYQKFFNDETLDKQRLWLKFQRNTCKETDCLMREYQQRIEYKAKFGTTLPNSSEFSATNIPDVPNASSFGEFSETVTISMYDPETKRMDQGEKTTNTLSIHKVSGKPQHAVVNAVLVFTNAHTCEIAEGKAVWVQNHWVIINDNQDQNAELRLYPASYKGKTQLLLRDIDNRYRGLHCGMRGYFDGMVLERKGG